MSQDQGKDDAQSFEQRLERLRGVVEKLERGETGLEESLALYKEGLTLSAELGRRLKDAQNEVRIVQDGLLKEFADLQTPESGDGEAGE